MIEHGSILVKREGFIRGDRVEHRIVDHQWQGPPLAAVSWGMIEDHHLKNRFSVGHCFRIGPFLVQVVEVHFEGWYLVRRLDQFALESWMRAKWATGLRFARGIGERCILTLAVWDLAEWPHGEIPSWGHVRRRVRKLLRMNNG